MINLKERENNIPDEFKEIAKDFSKKGFDNLQGWTIFNSTYNKYACANE